MVTDLFELHREVLWLLEPDRVASMARMQEAADAAEDPVMRQHFLDGVEYMKDMVADLLCTNCASGLR